MWGPSVKTRATWHVDWPWSSCYSLCQGHLQAQGLTVRSGLAHMGSFPLCIHVTPNFEWFWSFSSVLVTVCPSSGPMSHAFCSRKTYLVPEEMWCLPLLPALTPHQVLGACCPLLCMDMCPPHDSLPTSFQRAHTLRWWFSPAGSTGQGRKPGW